METTSAITLLLILAAISFAADDATGPALPDFDSLWNYSDPAGTEKTFRALLEPAAGAQDDSYYYALQTQIARCQGLQGKFPAAQETLNRVEKVLEGRDIPLVRVRYLLERGRVFNSSGFAPTALRFFEEAYALAKQHAFWNFAVDAAHMVAIAESTPAAQIEWNREALALTEAHPETDRWRPSIWNNLGEAYRSQREYDKALECFRSIIQWQTDHGKPVWRYARVDECKMLRLLGHGGDAMKRIRALYEELAAAGETDGVVSEELAENLLSTGDEAAAREQFVKAWEQLKDEQWLKDAEPQRYERLKQFGSN